MLDPYPIPPFTASVNGTVQLPGSKSITNRALILAALSKKTTTLTGVLFSRDSELMLKALQILGVHCQIDPEQHTVIVHGVGPELPIDHADLFIGNAGTAARFLSALICLKKGGTYTLDGDPPMRMRPMRELLSTLEALGATFEFHEEKGHFPFTVKTNGISGGIVQLDATASSQFVSALLMIAPFADTPLEIIAPEVRPAFVHITVEMIRTFGGSIEEIHPGHFKVKNDTPYLCPNPVYAIEPDVSAGSYFIALPLAVGGQIKLPGLPLEPLQGDTRFAQVAELYGATIKRDSSRWIIKASPATKGPFSHNFSTFSDTFLTLAAITPLFTIPTRIEGIAHTRAQETDRVSGVVTELKKLGIKVIEENDAIEIYPDSSALEAAAQKGVTIETYEDHRFAMSFAILGSKDVRGDGTPWLHINDPLCCKKTFPDFFDCLASLHPSSVANHFKIIAIDGGAASGKSSTSKRVAAQLNYLHVDTGAHYRALTHAAIKAGIEPLEKEKLVYFLNTLRFETVIRDREAYLALNGQVTAEIDIRSEAVNHNVSQFAAIPAVRDAIMTYQRDQAQVARKANFAGLIMDGRDIGTVIFPQADLKIFLFADEATRTARRAREGQADTISERDKLDSARKTAPLIPAENAIQIDNSALSLEQVVSKIIELTDSSTQ